MPSRNIACSIFRRAANRLKPRWKRPPRVPTSLPRSGSRLDYTSLWLREGDEDFKGVCEVGEAFIKSWPKSQRRDEVRMKIAQAYFRQEDYPKARAQFEQLVEDRPDSPYAEVAQFFAARSAMSTLNAKDLDMALDHFSEVAERGGALAAEARRQMALIKRLQGKEGDALAAVERVLPPSPRRRVTNCSRFWSKRVSCWCSWQSKIQESH